MIAENLEKIKKEIPQEVSFVLISKTHPVEEIMEAYNAGQRIFGENKVQEMETKFHEMPKDIEWHMVGHLQRNKVKYMAPFVTLVHAVDSLRLLREIDKEAEKNDRTIKCLLQIKIAKEESKFGMDEDEAEELLFSEEIKNFKNIKIVGLMGMATFTEDQDQVSSEFKKLKMVFDKLKPEFPEFNVLSMGMSGDYKLAIAEGSSMIRVGSAVFGERSYS